jgi:hypothetical protein
MFYILFLHAFLSEFFVLMYKHFCNFLHLVLEIVSALSCGVVFYTFVLTIFLLRFSNIAYKKTEKYSCIFHYFNPVTFYWKACCKPGKWSVMYISVEDIDFVFVSTMYLLDFELFWLWYSLFFILIALETTFAGALFSNLQNELKL